MICHVGSEQSSEVQPILQRLCSEPLTNDDDIVFNKTRNKYHERSGTDDKKSLDR